MHRWSRFLASLLFILPAAAQAQEMDFSDGEEGDAPPPDGVEAPPPEEPVEPAGVPDEAPVPDTEGDTRSPAYIFAITTDAELARLTRELDVALRDVLLGSPRYTVSGADALVNGRDFEANEALQQAEELFNAGRLAYDNLELDESVELFSQAVQVYEERIGHVTELNNISDCFLYLGAAEVLRGRLRQARTPFLNLLIIDPERRPDPDLFPPPVTEAFDYVVSQVERIRDGQLTVTSSPEGADVYVDGVYQGLAPQENPAIKAGRHYLRVRLQGHREVGQVIEVSQRRPTEVGVSLEPTEDGEVIAELLDTLATQIGEGSEEAGGTVQRIGEVLNLEVLFTAVVARGDDGVGVQLNGWDVMRGSSIHQQLAGPFADEAIQLIGDVQPAVDEMLVSTWNAMNTPQAPVEPVIVPQPDLEPEPRPRRPFWQQWWFWTAVGAVVIGAGLGIGFGAAAAGDDDTPNNGEVILDL